MSEAVYNEIRGNIKSYMDGNDTYDNTNKDATVELFIALLQSLRANSPNPPNDDQCLEIADEIIRNSFTPQVLDYFLETLATAAGATVVPSNQMDMTKQVRKWRIIFICLMAAGVSLTTLQAFAPSWSAVVLEWCKNTLQMLFSYGNTKEEIITKVLETPSPDMSSILLKGISSVTVGAAQTASQVSQNIFFNTLNAVATFGISKLFEKDPPKPKA